MSNGTLVDKLLDITRDPSKDFASPLVADFDWAAAGVSTPYIMFFTGRCGSTWLTSLIRETGLAGAPEEFLNEDVARSAVTEECVGFPDYFARVVRHWTTKGRFGLQMDPVRLRQVLKIIDLGKIFGGSRAKVFYMYRHDILSQAWSWAAARKSGKWHSRWGEEQRVDSEPPALADIAREIYRLRRDEEYLHAFMRENGMDAFPIEYEWVVTESMGALTAIFTVMGVPNHEITAAPAPKGNKLNRLEYGVKQQTIARLWSACPQACEAIFRKRTTITSEELRDALTPVFGSEILAGV